MLGGVHAQLTIGTRARSSSVSLIQMDQPIETPDIAIYEINVVDGDGADMSFDYNLGHEATCLIQSSYGERM